MQEKFKKIPGSPISYWVSNLIFELFETKPSLYSVAPTKKGMFTGNNDLFLKLWFEISYPKFNNQYKPYCKGGGFRKWYGNNEYVVFWGSEGEKIKSFKGSGNINEKYYFQKCITWGLITSDRISFRYIDTDNFVMGDAGPATYPNSDMLFYILGCLNSKVGEEILELINPTINFSSGVVGKFPVQLEANSKIDNLTKKCYGISKRDWNSFETSWDFSKNPLLIGNTIREAFESWKEECERDFIELKSSEEELNRIFIEIYGLQDELIPEVEDKDITLITNTAYRYKQKKKKNSENEFEPEEEIVEAKEIRDQRFLRDTIIEFISYAVGCMFGRYSLIVEGLSYAGGAWDENKYSSFIPDRDNIIPICDDEYFDDDITGRFIEFIKTVYDEKLLEDNLNFIADALGGKDSSREIIRNYFINDFFKDHCNMYTSRGAGKRPIYWLFDSGKKNGFKALCYMHRYSSDLLAKLRTDYVHEQQERYRTQLSHIAAALSTATGSERARLLKQQNKLTEQLKEINTFEEKVHHLADQNIEIDLDDGVKKNYEIFTDVLAKI